MIFFNNIIFANFYDVPVISTSIRNFIPSLQIHLVLKVVKSVPKSFTKSVQLSSVTHSCQNLCNPMDCSTPGFPCPSASPKACSNSCPSHRCCHPTISSCHPLLLPPSIFPSIRVFSNESALRIRWLKYCGFI